MGLNNQDNAISQLSKESFQRDLQLVNSFLSDLNTESQKLKNEDKGKSSKKTSHKKSENSEENLLLKFIANLSAIIISLSYFLDTNSYLWTAIIILGSFFFLKLVFSFCEPSKRNKKPSHITQEVNQTQ